MIGKTLGHYRIAEKIGSGGMGEVYRAQDEHLARDVAIKVLPEGMLENDLIRKHFRSEALTLSRLSHPNIATIFDFDSQDGVDFLVMEYIPGVTLRKRLANGPLNETEIYPIALQLAEGLSEAHARGIVHRDLKPGNLILTPEDRLKILDFGLAKILPSSHQGISDLSTRTQAAPGTLPYMAPEQLLGEKVDVRTDIYAAGTMLYEMVTGKHPFQRKVPGALVDDILHKAPLPPGEVRRELSPRLEEIILKCMEKNPENRYQSAKELAIDLRRLNAAAEPMIGASNRGKRARLLRMLIAAAAGFILLVTLGFVFNRIFMNPVRFYEPMQVTNTVAWEGQAAISPDGNSIVCTSNASGKRQILRIDINNGMTIPLSDGAGYDEEPAWYPDASSVAFTSDRGGSTGIWKGPSTGSNASLLLPHARHPAISPDLQWIAFSQVQGNGYRRIGIARLSPPMKVTILTKDKDGIWDHDAPAWSPDGKEICYSSRHNLWIVPIDGGAAKPLTTDGELDSDPAWCPDGSHIYFSSYRGGTVAIWRVERNGGSPERVTAGNGQETHPSISKDGTRLAYSTGIPNRQLIIQNRVLRKENKLSSSSMDLMPSISADSKQVVYISRGTRSNYQLVLQPLNDGLPAGPPRIVGDQAGNVSTPAFSPDGEWIAYYRIRGPQREIWMIRPDTGMPMQFDVPGSTCMQPSWSPDGKRIAYVSQAEGKSQIWIAGFKDGKPSGELNRTTDDSIVAMAPSWSPDGSRLAFIGAKGDSQEAWLVPADGNKTAEQITTGANAVWVRWDQHGRALLVSGTWGEGRVSLRRVNIEDKEVQLFDPPVDFGSSTAAGLFDVSVDERFMLFSQEELRGDIWVHKARRGVY